MVSKTPLGEQMVTKIRPFEFSDLDAIVAIDVKSYEDYWTNDEFNTKLKQKSINCLLAVKENFVIGFIIYEVFLYRFSLLRIGVLPRFRRQKTGSQLLNTLAEKLNSKRTLIAAEVRESNLGVQLFMKKNMYKATEVIRDYYEDTGESCYVFQYRKNATEGE